MWHFLVLRIQEYDLSRPDEQWRALTPQVCQGQVSLIDMEVFYTRWQRLLPLSNKTRPHVIREQLLSKLWWIKEKVSEKEVKNSQCRCVVDLSGLDPLPGCAPFENETQDKLCSKMHYGSRDCVLGGAGADS